MLFLSSYISENLRKHKKLFDYNKPRSRRLVLLILYLIAIAIGIEGNIFIVSFPTLMEVFHTTEQTIQMTLIVNFIGMCFAGLVCGPLSDSYGRRKVLLVGAGIFIVGSMGCIFVSTMPYFLLSRFLQGIGSGAILTVSSIVVFDLYSLKEAIYISTIFGSFISLLLAFSPTLGAILYIIYGWKANFILITVLAIFSLLLIYLFIYETLPAEQKHTFSFNHTLKNYKVLLKNPIYIGNLMVCYCMSWAFIIFEANVPFIFMNYLGVSQKMFGIYQATIMLSFVFSSFVLAWFIEKYSLAYSAIVGAVIGIIGIIFLIGVAYWFYNSPFLISTAISIIEIGAIFCSCLFAARAMEAFPVLRGTSIALSGSLRLLMTSLVIFLSGFTFDGTIVPITWIIVICAFMCIILIWFLQKLDST